MQQQAFPAGREVEVAEPSQWILQERCRLVTLLQSGDPEGGYLPGYQGYGRLIGRLGESAHQSCVLLTSREKPREIVGQAVFDLFGGDLDRFLQEGELVFNGVRPLLRQQVGRLSALEHLLLTWLAVLREWTPLDALAQVLHPRVLRAQLLAPLAGGARTAGQL
jgi:hypothetical protein